jgi:hypothetical protein
MKNFLKLAGAVLLSFVVVAVIGSLFLVFGSLFWLIFCAIPRTYNFIVWVIVLTGLNRKKRKILYCLRNIKSHLLSLEASLHSDEGDDFGYPSWAYKLAGLKEKLTPALERFENRSKKLGISAWRINRTFWLASR